MNYFQKNTMQFEFKRLGLDEEAGLNLLTEQGLISDLCVLMPDIAFEDAQKSLNWLRQQPTKK